MKRLKKSLLIGVLMAFVVTCLSGCLRMDLGVELREDGTASVTYKLMMEEDAYNALLAFDSGDAEEGGEPADEDEVDLREFQKETVDGEVYYTYQKTEEVESYDALGKLLVSDGDEEGVDLFSAAEVKKEENKYMMQLVTSLVEDSDGSEGEDSTVDGDMSLGSDWLSLTMTVKMPGKITETTGEQLDDNTVRFVLDDFSEAHTLMVKSEVAVLKAGEVIFVVACLGVIVGCVVLLVMRKKRG